MIGLGWPWRFHRVGEVKTGQRLAEVDKATGQYWIGPPRLGRGPAPPGGEARGAAGGAGPDVRRRDDPKARRPTGPSGHHGPTRGPLPGRPHTQRGRQGRRRLQGDLEVAGRVRADRHARPGRHPRPLPPGCRPAEKDAGQRGQEAAVPGPKSVGCRRRGRTPRGAVDEPGNGELLYLEDVGPVQVGGEGGPAQFAAHAQRRPQVTGLPDRLPPALFLHSDRPK